MPPTILASSRAPIWRISMRACRRAARSLDQIAEIDALLGGEVEEHLAAGERVLDADQLHRQRAVANLLLAEEIGVALLGRVLVAGAFVDGGGAAEDAAQRVEDGQAARSDGDGADERTAIALDDDALPAA